MVRSTLPAILATDVGTTTIKAAVVDINGRLRGLHQRPTPYRVAAPPAFEVEMQAVLASALAAMREALVELDSADRARISAIAVTALGDGLWLLDAAGQAIEPALVWRDSRSISVLERWRREGRSRAVARYTGTEPTTAHQTTQLAWLAQVNPERVKRARHVCFAEDWIGYALTGQIGMGIANYEHTYGHLHRPTSADSPPNADFHERVHERVLDLLDLRWACALIPELHSPLEARGMLTPSAAAQLGLPAGTPVFVGPFDVLSGMFGSGAVELDQAASILGTAAIHQRWTQAFRDDALGYLVSHPQQQARWLRFVATSAGIVNLEYWRRVLFPTQLNDPWDTMEQRLTQLAPGADGLIYLPYLTAGEERSEAGGWSLGGCFLGVNELHTPDHLMRAVYEGLAVQAARIYQHLQQGHLRRSAQQDTHHAYASSASEMTSDPPLREIRLGGGGSQSNLLADLLAQCIGLEVSRPLHPEVSLLGVAVVAWTALHPGTSLDAWAQRLTQATMAERFVPRPELQRIFVALRQQVTDLLGLACGGDTWSEHRRLRRLH